MGLFGWFKSKQNDGNSRLVRWRRAWTASLADPAAEQVSALGAQLDALGLSEDEIEIEREMLDGLSRLAELQTLVGTTGLPVVETGHRIVGADCCHFSAPVSMPDDATQPTGRLLMTSARAIFVGGSRATTVAWHGIAEIVQTDRDVILVKKDRETIYRFRCNSFADAICGAYLARRLSAPRLRTAPVPPA